MKNSFLLISIFIFCFITSCNQTSKKELTTGLRVIVEKRNELLTKYFLAGDAENLAALYSDSAKLCPDGSNFVNGRENIKKFWKEDFSTSKVLDMRSIQFSIDGNKDIIYETGITSNKILYKDSVYQSTVKYINVWIKQSNGDYLLDIDFWNRKPN